MKKTLVMAPSDFFEVRYAINPHMTPGSVDVHLAQKQWHNLRRAFSDNGFTVKILPSASAALPDYVFCANHGLLLTHLDGNQTFLPSMMATPQRAAEVTLASQYFYDILSLPIYIWPEHLRGKKFEGMGDVIFRPEALNKKKELWTAHGFRSDEIVLNHIETLTELKLIKLKLINPYFYHLDTSLVFLDHDSALYFPDAFDKNSQLVIQNTIPRLYRLNIDEAMNFAANSFCADGQNVFVPLSANAICEKLNNWGFHPILVDTSEFQKAGGSIYCMKLEL